MQIISLVHDFTPPTLCCEIHYQVVHKVLPIYFATELVSIT